MRKILFILLLLPFLSVAQKPQQITTWGLRSPRFIPDTLQGVPQDTFPVPSAYRTLSFVAAKHDTLYIWNRTYWKEFAGGAGGVDSVSSVAARHVADLRAIDYFAIAAKKKSSNDKVFVKTLGCVTVNDGGGGDWYYDETSTETDNTGTVVKPTSISGAGRWKRILKDRVVNVKWFGFIGAGSYPFSDNRTALINALNAAAGMGNELTNTKNKGQLYIPGDSSRYYISDSIVVPGDVEIFGDYSHYPGYATRLYFVHTKGFIFRYDPTTGTGVRNWKMENIMLENGDPYNDSTGSFGIWTNTRCDINNVAVFYFSGNGIEINTSYGGNCNSSMINDVQLVGNKNNGLFLRGQESNNLEIRNCLAINNGYWGVQDSSFLGNNYYNLHTEQNSVRTDIVNSSCTHGGQNYYCSRNNTNIEPGVTSGWQSYWYPTSGGVYGPAWNSTTAFRGGGAIALDGTVQYGTVTGCYTEGDEGPSVITGAFTTIFGGNMGAGFAGGPSTAVSAHGVQGFLEVDGLGVEVTDDPNYQNAYQNNIQMHHNYGFTVVAPNSGGYTHWGSDTAAKTSMFYGQVTRSNKAFEFTTAGFPISKLNWDPGSGSAPCLPMVTKNLYFRSNSNADRVRGLGMDSVAPAAVLGNMGKGDIILNNGQDPTILGWKQIGGTWTQINTGNISLAAVGSSPNANGATLSGGTLTLQPASATQPGVVSTTNQTFLGNKTVRGNIESEAGFGNLVSQFGNGAVYGSEFGNLAYQNVPVYIKSNSNTLGHIIFSPGNSEKVRIDAGGNVGIGTGASPTHTLTVNGQIKVFSPQAGDIDSVATWKDGVLSATTAASLGVGFTLTNGNGTTANGTAVDLGGTVNTAIAIDDASAGSNNFDIGRNTNFSRFSALADNVEITGNTTLSLAGGTINTTGTIKPTTDNAYDLGDATHQWKDLYMTGASIYMAGTKTLSAAGLDLPSGGGIRTRTGLGNTVLLQAYDVDGAAYKTWGTLTANNTPSLALSNPAGATFTIDGATIGATTAAAGTFTTVNATTGFQVGGAAASGKFLVGNGTNYVASTSTIPTSAGTSGKILVSDGTNYVSSTPTFPNASATSGKIIKSDGTNWVASTETYAAPGTSGNVLKSDGTNWTSAANTGEWTTLQVSGSDATTTGQTLVDVTGLVTPTLTTSSNYEIEAMLIVTTSTGTAGTEYGVNCTGASTTQGIIYIGPTTVSGGVQVMAENGTNTNNTAATPAMLTTASETGVVWIRGVVGTGTGTPTIAIRHLKVTSGTSTVKVGSIMRYRKL